MLRSVVLLLSLLWSLSLFAGAFKLTCTTGPAEVCSALETEINKNLPNADATTYLKGMSNAQTLSGKGVGVDYASHFDIFTLGASLGAAADTGGSSFSKVVSGDVDSNNLRGIGVTGGIMAGLNLDVLPFDKLWFLNLSRTKFYFHTFSYKKTSGKVSGKADSLGFHFQYKLKDGKKLLGLKMLEWDGLEFTTGYESSKLTFNYSETLNKQVTVSGQSATYAGPVGISAKTSTTSIPFELSTAVRWLYFFSTYGGLGMDLNSGKSTVDASSTGTISGAITGTGAINLGTEGKPQATDFRYFIGQQINLPLVKLYVQMNQSITNDTVGAAAGLRIAW